MTYVIKNAVKTAPATFTGFLGYLWDHWLTQIMQKNCW